MEPYRKLEWNLQGSFKCKFERPIPFVNLRGESGAHEAPSLYGPFDKDIQSKLGGIARGGNLSGAFRHSVGTL